MKEHHPPGLQDESNWSYSKFKVKHYSRNRRRNFKDLFQEKIVQFLKIINIIFAQIVPCFTIKQDTVDE